MEGQVNGGGGVMSAAPGWALIERCGGNPSMDQDSRASAAY